MLSQACTAERFFRIDRAQEHLHYVVDICNDELYVLDPADDAGTSPASLDTSGSTCNLFPAPVPSSTEPNTIVLFQPDPIESNVLQQFPTNTTTVCSAQPGMASTLSGSAAISLESIANDSISEPTQQSQQTSQSLVTTAPLPMISIEQQLLSAAAAGHTDRLLQLIQIGADPTCLDAHGRSCLHLSAENGWTATTHVLLQQNNARKLLHQPDRVTGRTPLHAASFTGRQSICEMLLNAGADPRKLDGDGRSSMQLALQAGHTDLGNYLQCKLLVSFQSSLIILINLTIL